MRKTTALIACFVIYAAVSCGKNPAENKPPAATTTSLTATVLETTGKGISGFEISTAPATVTVATDSAGKAILNDIPFGIYEVLANKNGYPTVTKTGVVNTGPGEIWFRYIPEATVRFTHAAKGPYKSALVTAEPYGFSGRTDDQGRVVFTGMPEGEYTFTLHRDGFADVTHTGVSPATNPVFETANAPPQVSIISPTSGALLASSRPVTFTGIGSDSEGIVLPDTSLVWYLDPGGELGRGARLVVKGFAPGDYRINLIASDIYGTKAIASAIIKVQDYQQDSYFPTLVGESWSYRFLVPEFWVATADTSREYWVMKDLSARMYDRSRVVTMLYDITKGKKTTHFRYTVTDFIDKKASDLVIAETKETSDEWETGSPFRTIAINTIYTPPYVMFRNLNDPSDHSFKTDIQVAWSYMDYGVQSATYSESETLSIASRVLGVETIETGKGSFPALRVVTAERGIEKTVWLAKGIGPIRFEDNTFMPKATVMLTDASLLRFASKPALAYRPADRTDGVRTPPVFRIDRRDPRGMREFHRLLASMIPR